MTSSDRKAGDEGRTLGDGKVPCPECGLRFLPRGLASHRRQKHRSIRKATAPLSEAPPAPEAAPPGLLEAILAVLERMDSRLERLELIAQPPSMKGRPRVQAAPIGTQLEALRRELEDIVAEIALATVMYEQGAAEHLPAGVESCVEVREASRKVLGDLRRKQATILFRMGPAAPGAQLDADGHVIGFL